MPITDEHLALIDAFAAASTWPAQQAALREHHTTLTAPEFSATLAALTDLYPANPVPGQLLTLLDEITQTSMDATIGRRQADHDRRALLDAWISTPTWAESRTFLIDHREALLADDMAELLASADHDTARQHLAILNLAAALPTEAVYGIITDPGHAEDAILDALETGDLAQLRPILTAAGSSFSERPLTANLALAVRLLMQNDPERALDVGREIAEHSTAIQLRHTPSDCNHLLPTNQTSPELTT